jgi:hypothetical protein
VNCARGSEVRQLAIVPGRIAIGYNCDMTTLDNLAEKTDAELAEMVHALQVTIDLIGKEQSRRIANEDDGQNAEANEGGISSPAAD